MKTLQNRSYVCLGPAFAKDESVPLEGGYASCVMSLDLSPVVVCCIFGSDLSPISGRPVDLSFWSLS